MTHRSPPARCPCGSARDYTQCCQPLHQGLNPATSPEQLMRARYSAYVKQALHYLRATWHPSTRPEIGSLKDTEQRQWLGLKVIKTQTAGTKATVEFIARFKVQGRATRQHEISVFERLEDGCWYYRAPESLN